MSPRPYNPDEWRDLTVEEVEPLLEDTIEGIVEGWYLDEPLDSEAFLDRLDGTRLPDGLRFAMPSQLDDPVVKKCLSLARKIKRECTS